MIKDRGYGDILNMWVYSRIDTVRRPEHLKLLKDAGINWLALGIESGERKIRLQASKGKFEDSFLISLYVLPINLLAEKIVFVGLVTACRLAGDPIKVSLSAVNATIDGVVLPPSKFVIITGFPASVTETQEFVVPKSIPIIFDMIIS